MNLGQIRDFKILNKSELIEQTLIGLFNECIIIQDNVKVILFANTDAVRMNDYLLSFNNGFDVSFSDINIKPEHTLSNNFEKQTLMHTIAFKKFCADFNVINIDGKESFTYLNYIIVVEDINEIGAQQMIIDGVRTLLRIGITKDSIKD